MERVHTFAIDKQMRDEVEQYIIDYLKEQIILRTFSEQDVVGYAEAKKIIEQCFKHMNEEFGGKKEETYTNENI